MSKSDYMTIPQLAAILGISRIAVYRRVKKGDIPAVRVGRMYAIDPDYVESLLGGALSETDKREIDAAIDKTIEDYGEVLRMLGRE